MTTNDQSKLIPLELPLDVLCWLRIFLREEISAAEIDHENVETLHTDVAIRAAKEALNRELAQMTKVADAVDVAIHADDAREVIAKKLAATLPAQPLAAMTPPVA